MQYFTIDCQAMNTDIGFIIFNRISPLALISALDRSREALATHGIPLGSRRCRLFV